MPGARSGVRSLDEVGFEVADGIEGIVGALTVFFVGHLVGWREDMDLASEAVPVSVEGATVARFGLRLRRYRMHNYLRLVDSMPVGGSFEGTAVSG
jgi:hypothetical protein